MPLSAGSRVGPYEILAQIGAGGMGEVYRAKDTALKREVALKVLPDAFAHDVEKMARFQREAEVLASLNHPNIAAIYGVAETGRAPALVMELVKGPTLAIRIKAGAIPEEESLDIAIQIAAALEYAHERDIVHRDLKPANVKVTPQGVVKLLDFGLAKALSETHAAGDPTNSTTLTGPRTLAGAIVGTAAYMAPEQARGKPVDKRADIWAFGVVLYEMLTGKRLYSGELVSDILAAVIVKEPDVQALPARLRPLIQTCLRKDPRLRWRDIGDVRIALEELSAQSDNASTLDLVPPARVTARRQWLWPAAAALFALTTLAIWAVSFREPPSNVQPVQLQIPVPENMTFYSGGTVSPDGRWLAIRAAGPDQVTRVWVRPLDSLELKPLEGTEVGAASPPPFWSPDSRFVAFATRGKLRKVAIAGGPPQPLCDTNQAIGGAWNRDGILLLGSNSGALTRCSVAGGPASRATTLEAGGIAHRWPQFLPDGRHFLYTRTARSADKTGVFVGLIDARPEQQSTTPLLVTDRQAYYAASNSRDDGWLLFVRNSTIMAQRFDPARQKLSGDAVPVAGPVGSYPPVNYALFSASGAGVLVYRGGESRWQLGWFDARGNRTGALGEPGQYANPAVSPDGNLVAVSQTAEGNQDIWVLDALRETGTRLTVDPARDNFPVWSPDGGRIVFASDRGGRFDLYQRAADGSGEDELLLKSDDNKFPQSWSRDGRYLLYCAISPRTHNDLWVLPLEGDRKPIPFQNTEFGEAIAQFSPDARWVAYTSTESGAAEIYVRPFTPNPGGESHSSGARWTISKGGGAYPRWRADSRQLFYRNRSGQLMAVDVAADKIFHAGVPAPLFDSLAAITSTYGMTMDGKRFLMVVPYGAGGRPEPLTVVLNWQAPLERR